MLCKQNRERKKQGNGGVDKKIDVENKQWAQDKKWFAEREVEFRQGVHRPDEEGVREVPAEPEEGVEGK